MKTIAKILVIVTDPRAAPRPICQMREDGKLADGVIRTLDRNRLMAGAVSLDASKLERYQGGALEYLLSHSL